MRLINFDGKSFTIAWKTYSKFCMKRKKIYLHLIFIKENQCVHIRRCFSSDLCQEKNVLIAKWIFISSSSKNGNLYTLHIDCHVIFIRSLPNFGVSESDSKMHLNNDLIKWYANLPCADEESSAWILMANITVWMMSLNFIVWNWSKKRLFKVHEPQGFEILPYSN